MKREWIFVLFLMIGLVSGCTSDASETEKVIEGVQAHEENSNLDKIGNTKHIEEAETPIEEDQQANEDPEVIESFQETAIEPMYKINESHWGVEPLQDTNEKVVLVTIDDAPDQYGLRMAENLKEQGVKAIFFVNGHFIDSPEEKDVLKQIYDLGFSIGNHTWNHKNLKELSEEEQFVEIIKLSDEIEVITGVRPSFFRAPFGANTDYTKELVKKEGMVLMNWTYGYDFMKDYMTKESIADIMVNTPLLTNGANLLMHDREWTFLALPDIVKGLKEKGYEIVDPKTIEIPTYFE